MFFKSKEDIIEFQKATSKLTQDTTRVIPEIKEDDNYRKSFALPTTITTTEIKKNYCANLKECCDYTKEKPPDPKKSNEKKDDKNEKEEDKKDKNKKEAR